jgi:apolipoprotein N-acyltransferase
MKKDLKMIARLYNIDNVLLIKWTGTVITLAGALCTALSFDPLNIILLNLGSFLFLIWGFMIKDKAMIAVNSGLLFIYFIGIILRL